MTAAEISALQPGDSIVGAFGLDDELHVEHIAFGYVYLRYSGTTLVPIQLIPGGPEIRGAQV